MKQNNNIANAVLINAAPTFTYYKPCLYNILFTVIFVCHEHFSKCMYYKMLGTDDGSRTSLILCFTITCQVVNWSNIGFDEKNDIIEINIRTLAGALVNLYGFPSR